MEDDDAVANTGSSSAEIAEQYNVPLYHDVFELISDVEFDGAVVSTHPEDVAETVVALAKEGKHVYVVKPGAMDHGAVDVLRGGLDKRSEIIVSGPTYRLHPSVLAAHQAYKDGQIGGLSSMRVMHQHGRLSTWGEGSWYRTEPDLTPALYLGWYVVDLVHLFAEESIDEVAALGSYLADPGSPQADTIRAVCRTESGVSASLDLYFGVNWHYPDLEFEVLGTDGAIRYNSMQGGAIYRGQEKIALPHEKIDSLSVEISRWVAASSGHGTAWVSVNQWLDVLDDCLTLQDALVFED